MSDALFSTIPRGRVLAALRRAPGNEVDSGKLDSRESSSALAANTFGLFIDRPGDLPELPRAPEIGWPAVYVGVEECVRFPWRGGRHPWLDAFVETRTHIVGLESKRYEPFRGAKAVDFSDAYWRDVWGGNMGRFQRLRDALSAAHVVFHRLDAVQLVKHALGLCAEGARRQKQPLLAYVYAEPETWSNGKCVDRAAIAVHRSEIDRFAEIVSGDEVGFLAFSYRELLERFRAAAAKDVREHASRLKAAFRP